MKDRDLIVLALIVVGAVASGLVSAMAVLGVAYWLLG